MNKVAEIKNLLEISKLLSHFSPLYLQIKIKPRLKTLAICEHARSQKFAMRKELFWGSGGGAPSAPKFCIFFLQKQLHFRAILIKKIMLFKHGIEIGSANMIKLVA